MMAKFSNIDEKVIVNGVEITDSESWGKVIDSIKELEQENQQLKIQISAREEEYRKLEDNWNELKEWLEIELGDRINPNKDKWLTGVYDAYRETIDKMQELEERCK